MAEQTFAFEDFAVGQVWPLGEKVVPAADMAAYAAEFDPREPYLFGQEAAPWHIGGLFMRQFYDHMLKGSTGRGSPGIENLTWPAPLLAGQTIRVTSEVIEVRASKSRPDTGLVLLRFVACNERDETVMSGTSWTMFGRREVQDAMA